MSGIVKLGNEEAELELGVQEPEIREVRPRRPETILGFGLISHNFWGRG